MTLEELSVEYAHTARQVYTRMAQLQRLEKASHNPKERHDLRRRILALQPLYRDAREISVITANYYKARRPRHEHYLQTPRPTPTTESFATVSAPCSGAISHPTPTANDDPLL